MERDVYGGGGTEEIDSLTDLLTVGSWSMELTNLAGGPSSLSSSLSSLLTDSIFGGKGGSENVTLLLASGS